MEATTLTDRIEKCERILKENGNSQVFAALADAYRLNGDLDQAFRVCRQGLRLHPDYGAGHLVMARINYERKMYDWAEQELDAAIAIDGETRATEQLRVEILIAKGNLGEAESAIGRLRGKGVNPLLIQELRQRLDRQRKEQRLKRISHVESPYGAQQFPESDVRTHTVAQPNPITLSQALDMLVNTDGSVTIYAALHDGTVLDWRGAAAGDPAEIAPLGVEMMRAAEVEASKSVYGSPVQIEIDTGEQFIVVVRLGRYNLMLLCDKNVNVGALRLSLDEIGERLQDS